MKKLSFLILLIGFPFIATLIEAGDLSVKIVVNASNPVSAMKRAQISSFFLKKTTAWDNGHKVFPVDQSESAAVRKIFSEEIHDKPVHTVISYWQKQIFSGHDVPPLEKDSDREVLTYIRENADAIGYVSEGAAIGDGVKVVKVLD